jgi:hypothetical protein
MKTSSCKAPFFLSDFNVKWIFWTDFRKKKKPQISNFVKIRPVEAELFQAHSRNDRRTDMTKLTVAFPNTANAPNISWNYKHILRCEIWCSHSRVGKKSVSRDVTLRTCLYTSRRFEEKQHLHLQESSSPRLLTAWCRRFLRNVGNNSPDSHIPEDLNTSQKT